MIVFVTYNTFMLSLPGFLVEFMFVIVMTLVFFYFDYQLLWEEGN